jgi:hypothetical protein
MTRWLLTVLGAVTLTGISTAAHHSHPDFLLDQSATITGEIERIESGSDCLAPQRG